MYLGRLHKLKIKQHNHIIRLEMLIVTEYIVF